MMNQLKRLFSILVFLSVGFLMYGQGATTSIMSGRITDGQGESLPGATVVATHQPSGTIYGATVNSQGLFSIQGMRPGGPYKVEISFVGFSKKTFTDINLLLGENFLLNTGLTESSTELNEVVVVGAKPSAFNTIKTGATTNITNEQMRLLPTINRSINDFARLSPYAAGNSFAGRDGRSNNFTVDGARLNNNFGLSDALPGGGNPISLDAIEEVQVVIAPYDVRQSNFIGGGINAITKSGTNTFRGSAYTYLYNQNMRGNKIDTLEGPTPAPESKNIYGFTFGGPIVKDKLFFFVNAEHEASPKQITNWRASTNGVANADKFISHARQSDLDEFSQLLSERYGYSTGSSTDFPGGVTNLKFLGRVDWNINNANKLSIRYNYTKNDNWVEPNGNSADNGYRLNNTSRIGIDAMSFMNSTYSMANAVNSFTAELNTRINNAISNQFLATYTNINDQRGSKSSPFPFIEIMNGDDVAAAGLDPRNSANFKPYMSAGYELFSWNNGVINTVMNFTDNFTYNLASHKFTAGVSYEFQSARNSYMRNGTGYYRFFSFSDFKNNVAPEAFALDYGYGGEAKPAGEVKFGQLSAYVQDEWDILNNLRLTYGVRLDNTFFLNDIMTNQTIYKYYFLGKHVDTGEWPETKFQASPRLGFNWDVFGNKSLRVRGGSGLFVGRSPLVFFTNVPQNGGMIQGTVRNVITTKYNSSGIITTRDPRLDNMYVDGLLMTDVSQMVDRLSLKKNITPQEGAFNGGDIAGIDKGFKMPQVWKSSLGVDYTMPVSFPLSITVEGMFTKDINAVRLVNINIPETNSSWATFDDPLGGRKIYPSNYKLVPAANAVTLLTNTNEGYGYTANITINSEPVKNLNLMAAYTHSDSYEISGMPGSAATSAWQGVPSVNGPNFSKLERSQYVTPDRVIASLNYRISFLNDLTSTEFGIFYNGFTPYKYSYTYTNDVNGDGINSDLIYIPASKDELAWATPGDGDRFWAFLENDKYLSKHKGEYAGAYAVTAPWVNRIDLHIAQSFAIKAGNTTNTLQVSLDFLNFGNRINSKWGVFKQMIPSARNGQILKYNGANKTYSFFSPDAIPETYTRYTDFTTQTWKLQLGLRYIFN